MSRTIKKLVGLVKEELRLFKLRGQKQKAALHATLALLPFLVSPAVAAITTSFDRKPNKIEFDTKSFLSLKSHSGKSQWLKEVLIDDQTKSTTLNSSGLKLMICDYKRGVINDHNCRIRTY